MRASPSSGDNSEEMGLGDARTESERRILQTNTNRREQTSGDDENGKGVSKCSKMMPASCQTRVGVVVLWSLSKEVRVRTTLKHYG